MAEQTFAEIENGVVKRVIVVTQAVLNTGIFGNPANWMQTNIDTQEGVNKKGETPLRKNYAGAGFKYDAGLDAFIPPQQFQSWTLDTNKGAYVSPKPCPVDGKAYLWNESKLDWVVQTAQVAVAEEPI